MIRHRNPITWLVWGSSVTLAVIVTRNPLYLGLVLIATAIVYLSQRSDSAQSGVWSVVVRIGVIVGVVTVAFNLLTAHDGDQVLARIPPNIPVIGGVITANALMYGISSALAILSLIVAAATLGTAVDRAALLRTVPRSLSSAGIAAVVGLSFFPQMLTSLREVRDAQAARGFRFRSVKDVRPVVLPVLSLALENAFNLAETMETRAFGKDSSGTARSWHLIVGILLTTLAVSLLIGGIVVAAIVSAVLGVTFIALELVGQPATRSKYRQAEWRRQDFVVVTGSVISSAFFATAILVQPSSVDWSPFPTLIAPTLVPWIGIACILLVLPAVTSAAP